MNEKREILFELNNADGDTDECIELNEKQTERLLDALALTRDRKIDEIQKISGLIRDIHKIQDKNHNFWTFIGDTELSEVYRFIAEAYIDSKNYNCQFEMFVLSFFDTAKCSGYGHTISISGK